VPVRMSEYPYRTSRHATLWFQTSFTGRKDFAGLVSKALVI
jgi:hypothetical protein